MATNVEQRQARPIIPILRPEIIAPLAVIPARQVWCNCARVPPFVALNHHATARPWKAANRRDWFVIAVNIAR